MSSTDRNAVQPLRILYLGPQAHGTNSGALAKAFRRAGEIVQTVDPEVFLPRWGRRNAVGRVLGKAIRQFGVNELNMRIIEECEAIRPDIFFVFKGPMLRPETLQRVKDAGAYVVLFFPDVSLYAHGDLIPKCLPLYDYIFTTKTFGVADLKSIGINCTEFVPHGFDPDVHREFAHAASSAAHLQCDASFIGTWSPKKEAMLGRLKLLLPHIDLRIWGNQWEKSSTPTLQPSIVGGGIEGDGYALAIQASRVNVAILSEARQGASSGDQITSRTFHIPASGGFMLHERTQELAQFFTEGTDVACFDGADELAKKIRYYLDHPDERELLRRQGHARCVAEDSLDARARPILTRLREKKWARRQS